jgi:hypothetical protein
MKKQILLIGGAAIAVLLLPARKETSEVLPLSGASEVYPGDHELAIG